MIELGGDALLDPITPHRCPFDGLPAWRTGTTDDDELGIEVTGWRCLGGHDWVSPSRAGLLRLIGWGPRWRWAREQFGASNG